MSKRVQSYSIVSYLKVKIVHVSWTPQNGDSLKWSYLLDFPIELTNFFFVCKVI